mmetsp:Transcript_25805/g.74298  ORF Transcript_25805/g.74298 Transcript_25805/m.74298 type:complete len:211 (-) Transcript_25805:96-728(-)
MSVHNSPPASSPARPSFALELQALFARGARFCAALRWRPVVGRKNESTLPQRPPTLWRLKPLASRETPSPPLALRPPRRRSCGWPYSRRARASSSPSPSSTPRRRRRCRSASGPGKRQTPACRRPTNRCLRCHHPCRWPPGKEPQSSMVPSRCLCTSRCSCCLRPPRPRCTSRLCPHSCTSPYSPSSPKPPGNPAAARAAPATARRERLR